MRKGQAPHKNNGFRSFLGRIMPDWVAGYNRSWLGSDLAAGLTVGIMLIPQGMAYAGIAGLPLQYGLYAAITPQIVYAFLGTSRQLAVGPVAMDSLLVAAGLSGLNLNSEAEYIAAALLLSFMMGGIQLLMGTFRLGFLVNFLSKPIISGFTSAAALIIGFNQLKHITGADLARNNRIDVIVHELFTTGVIHLPTIILSVTAVALLLYLKKTKSKLPAALIVVIFGILAALFIPGLDTVAVVGTIPQGLPGFDTALFEVDSALLDDLWPIALSLAVIAFMESISVAKAIEEGHAGEYDVRSNRELTALGLANFVGAFFQSYPTTGGFSRTAVADGAGAKTNLYAIVSALVVGLTLLYLTPLFYSLPKAILGAVIVVAVAGLVNLRYPLFLFRTKREEFFLLIVAFLVTLFWGIKEGIAVGAVLSILVMIYKTARPHYAILGRLPNTRDYRNTNRFTDLIEREDVLAFRYDAALYYANIDYFVDTVKSELKARPETKLLVLHCGAVHFMDATALEKVMRFFKSLQAQGIKVYLSGLIGPFRDYLTKSGFTQELPECKFFLDVQTAIDHYDSNSCTKEHFQRAMQCNLG